MTWTHTDTIIAMGSWGLVSLACSVVGSRCKQGPVRTGLLAFAAIGPLDVMRAWRVWTAVLFVALLTHCGGSDAVEKQIAVATYVSQQDQCVDLGQTRAQTDTCRKSVKTYWCGPHGYLHDAGECDYDGGPIITANGPQDGGGQ